MTQWSASETKTRRRKHVDEHPSIAGVGDGVGHRGERSGRKAAGGGMDSKTKQANVRKGEKREAKKER